MGWRQLYRRIFYQYNQQSLRLGYEKNEGTQEELRGELEKADFDWAVQTASRKKKIDCSDAEFLTVEEGLCVQIMHIGSFDDEPATVALMDKFLAENGYVNDFSDKRLHHEIYMSDARKVAPQKWKTVIRHPVKEVESESCNSI